MRLTLRTILAYLDDTLQPAQAREIGEKIAENKEATALVSQIREVLRRRRIGAPELAGPGSGPDPNLVAEYLENSLAPNQVVELERLTQHSDLHLAEIAACHKILTMVVGHPVDVSQEVKERMHLLGTHARPAAQADSQGLAPVFAEGMEQTGPQRKLDALPEYLTRGGSNVRSVLVAGLVLLGLGWLALVATDGGLWSRPEPVALKPAAKEPVVAPVPEPPPQEMVIAAAVVPLGNDLPPAPGPAAPVAAPPSVPQANVPANPPVNPSANPPANVPAANPPVPNPPPASPPQVAFVELDIRSRSGDGITIGRIPFEPEWKMLDVTAPVVVGLEFATPAPFRQEFSIGEVGSITLEPGTRITRVTHATGAQVAFKLIRGRIVLQRALTATEPVVVQVDVRGKRWFVSLDEAGTRVGIEASPASIVDVTQPISPPASAGGIVLANGRAQVWLDGVEKQQLPAANQMFAWNADLTQLNLATPMPLPTWAGPEGIVPTQAAKLQARTYEKEFLRDRTISQSIAPVVKDRRGNIADLAVRTIGLTENIIDLLPGLSSEQPEPRQATIEEVRLWLAEDITHADTLKSELLKLYRPEQVQVMHRLLLGITAVEARDAAFSQAMVEWLANDEVIIRELAIQNLARLTGKTYDYLSFAPAHERRAAITRWEDVLRRNNGSVLPAM